ncbi:hypothetical protein SAY87_006506 [Trapa incisa]|uniref:Endonuclease/exonuclease/phosphatase domain-containing protein n=1 Tax=Trapa incisa TaxID=236973 RepID=A0AAN7PZJ3_9MYRT|nr:hypothetical protein SAY87_006506 [Trapa incisa]
MAIDVSSASFFSPFSPMSTPSIPCLIRSVKRLPFPPSPWSCSSSSFRFSSNYAAPGSSSNRSSYSRRWINPLSNGTSQEVVRQWIEADTSISSQDKFTVASYNILGDRNASKHRDLYSNIPSSYINWGRRKRVICEELMEWDPDIICLQEVDRYFDLSEDLRRGGYAGSYKKRTGDSADGCAIFWKSNKFHVLQAESIEFKSIGLRDNVAQLSIFEVNQQTTVQMFWLFFFDLSLLYSPSTLEQSYY